MVKYLIILVLFLQFTTNIQANEVDLKPGDLFHITGYENGELVAPIVNLWDKPGGLGAGAKVIGKLSGDGREDQGLKGQGSVVKLLEIKKGSSC
ncbi:MAG: hypothetical protein AUJ48_04340 [Deltaproteobacteria bacterium CG1_02_45_11]|nr:MAG: hypothetical protein AUJ48_04340 [Deltaproteobacteria bacterium CG1_02_45_11]